MEISALITGAILGAIPSWFISKAFANKSSTELDSKLRQQTTQIGSTSTFNHFERMLRTSKWHKENINHHEVWVCEKDNTLQIHIGDDNREFHEKWTDVFPDQNISMFHIELKINETIIKSLPFISADGGRYTIPLPELSVTDEMPMFYWFFAGLCEIPV